MDAYPFPYPPDAQARAGRARDADGGHVVVVDDSRVVRKILEVSLRRAGYVVECFEDGIEALRSLQAPERAWLPDLVILDVMLPKMDGYEVAIYLKRCPELRGIAIVMLSCRDGLLDRVKARLAGANAYLTKPFSPHEVTEVVRGLLAMAKQAARSQGEEG